jgi:hypothetical protein
MRDLLIKKSRQIVFDNSNLFTHVVIECSINVKFELSGRPESFLIRRSFGPGKSQNSIFDEDNLPPSARPIRRERNFVRPSLDDRDILFDPIDF